MKSQYALHKSCQGLYVSHNPYYMPPLQGGGRQPPERLCRQRRHALLQRGQRERQQLRARPRRHALQRQPGPPRVGPRRGRAGRRRPSSVGQRAARAPRAPKHQPQPRPGVCGRLTRRAAGRGRHRGSPWRVQAPPSSRPHLGARRPARAAQQARAVHSSRSRASGRRCAPGPAQGCRARRQRRRGRQRPAPGPRRRSATPRRRRTRLPAQRGGARPRRRRPDQCPAATRSPRVTLASAGHGGRR